MPSEAVNAKSVKHFEIILDKHWEHQEVRYDFRAELDLSTNRGSDVKLHKNEQEVELDIVAKSASVQNRS